MQLTDGADGDSPMTLLLWEKILFAAFDSNFNSSPLGTKTFSVNYVDRVHIILFLFLLTFGTRRPIHIYINMNRNELLGTKNFSVNNV